MPTIRPTKYAEESVRPSVLNESGEGLAAHLSIEDDHCKFLYQSATTTVENQIKRKLSQQEPWGSIAATHFRVIYAKFSGSKPDYLAMFDAQKNLVSTYNDWLRSDSTAWSLPVMYVISHDLRQFAIHADRELEARGEKIGKLAETARLIQTSFGICCIDRSSSKETKKVGVLYMASLLFKIYFKLNSTALCKNVIRGVENADLSMGLYIPMSHRVTYRYYMGVLSFLQEDYDKAEDHLSFAFNHCHRDQLRNRELILNYLIPIRLLKGKRPVNVLLERSVRLHHLYSTFIEAVKTGNIELFDRHMAKVEKQLLTRGTYLVAERCRDICLCNLVKLIYRLKSENHQIPLQAFEKVAHNDFLVDASLPTADFQADKIEEVECVLANLIAQDRVRGYIHHEAKMLVLSKRDPFPVQVTILK
ncbi:hypothetical protein CROQUDRAFT_688491 [Cronartium quercuum f. sp. fusiforme G11]|uniref:PCI domain-containing protein n=1 Tax=Cronartium quercuum f. sp. fusiforme G11 TaxID=708437 RepID=A0A9P6TEG1_9BASI|nr:hypothetical protein CROQUDRAFT_688491 [Cronartium quercuum f. sp. fusiforme G11]